MQLKRQIPNIITAGNLFFGCLAIFFALTGHLSWAPWCILISAVLDFFDGFAARKLGVSGELGKQLDSLADMVTFGVAPGIIVVLLINFSITHSYEIDKKNIKSNVELLDNESIQNNYLKDVPDLLVLNSIYNHSRAMHFNKGVETTSDTNESSESAPWIAYLPFIGLLIPVFSMVRLGKFNIDTRQTDGFLGLATPANTIFFAGFVFVFQDYLSNWDLPQWKESIAAFILDFRTLIALSIVFSILMVSEIPMFSLKVKGFGWKGNEIRYIFLLICIGLILMLHLWSLPFIILTYILISVGVSFFGKKDLGILRKVRRPS